MSLEDLRSRFIQDESTISKEALAPLVEKALEYCVVDTGGRVHIRNPKLAGKQKAKLVLAARLIANQLDDKITAITTAEDVATSTGIPLNQSRARLSEIADEGFADVVERGSYRAKTFRVSAFLSELEER